MARSNGLVVVTEDPELVDKAGLAEVEAVNAELLQRMEGRDDVKLVERLSYLTLLTRCLDAQWCYLLSVLRCLMAKLETSSVGFPHFVADDLERPPISVEHLHIKRQVSILLAGGHHHRSSSSHLL